MALIGRGVLRTQSSLRGLGFIWLYFFQNRLLGDDSWISVYNLSAKACCGYVTLVHTNPFLEFHELGEPVVSNASLVFDGLHKSLQSGLLELSSLFVTVVSLIVFRWSSRAATFLRMFWVSFGSTVPYW